MLNNHRLSFVACVLLTCCFHTMMAQTRCDPSLPPVPNNPLSYHDLGDRCEGIYIEEVGGTTLKIVAFSEFFDEYSTKSNKPLNLVWNKPPGNDIIRIRAQGIRRKLYYRMDATSKHDNTTFAWPSNVLSSLDIAKDDIAVAASTKYKVGDKEREVLLPLRISQQLNITHPATGYNLVLIPGEELQEVFISLAKINADGKQEFVMDGVKLGYGYYPADRSIEVPVTGLTTAGTYYIQIGATLKSGGTATIEAWIYNPVNKNKPS